MATPSDAAIVLTQGAEADLRSITRYTFAQWGEKQCRSDIAELEERATALALGKGGFKDMSSLLPGLRVAACRSHYIICMHLADTPAQTLAILHERMDGIARLKSGLDV